MRDNFQFFSKQRGNSSCGSGKDLSQNNYNYNAISMDMSKIKSLQQNVTKNAARC